MPLDIDFVDRLVVRNS